MRKRTSSDSQPEQVRKLRPEPRERPAFYQTCDRCKRRGHFADLCRSERRQPKQYQKQSNFRQSNAKPRTPNALNAVQCEEPGEGEYEDQWSSDEDVYQTQNINCKSTRKLLTNLKVQCRTGPRQTTLKTLLDTGATINVIGVKVLDRLKRREAMAENINTRDSASLGISKPFFSLRRSRRDASNEL